MLIPIGLRDVSATTVPTSTAITSCAWVRRSVTVQRRSAMSRVLPSLMVDGLGLEEARCTRPRYRREWSHSAVLARELYRSVSIGQPEYRHNATSLGKM